MSTASTVSFSCRDNKCNDCCSCRGLNEMCLTGVSLHTHAAQILQLPGGVCGGQKTTPVPQGRPNHPFSDTHLSYPPHRPLSPPPPFLPSYRRVTLQPAGVSCAEGAPCSPALGPEPRRKSAAVPSREPCLARGPSPSLAPSVPGL